MNQRRSLNAIWCLKCCLTVCRVVPLRFTLGYRPLTSSPESLCCRRGSHSTRRCSPWCGTWTCPFFTVTATAIPSFPTSGARWLRRCWKGSWSDTNSRRTRVSVIPAVQKRWTMFRHSLMKGSSDRLGRKENKRERASTSRLTPGWKVLVLVAWLYFVIWHCQPLNL